MNDMKEERLKKQLVGDNILVWIGTVGVGIVALSKVFTAIRMFKDVNSGAKAYDESPALVLGDGIRSILIAVVFVLLSMILSEISKNGKPFVKSNVVKLRVMAVLMATCFIVPMVTASIAGFFDPNATFTLTIATTDLFFVFIGGVIAIISEIFHYGYELQDEMDAIA